MSKKLKTTNASSWRSILQSGRSPAVTPEARKRLWVSFFKWTAFSMLTMFVFFISVWGYFYYKKHSSTAYFNKLSQPISHFDIYTDGSLSEPYILKACGLGDDISMMNVDIFGIKQKLEALGQVHSAIVERQFPETLKIAVEEYKPVFKVVAVDSSGEKQGLLVSAEGHVYKGRGYTREQLQKLPYIQDVPLKRSLNGFEPIKHIRPAVELLKTAAIEKPRLFVDWKSVSLKHLRPENLSFGSFIKVTTKDAIEIIFAPEKYTEQLNHLGSILEYSDEQHLASIERIDLSLGNQVAVKIARNNPSK